MSRPWDENAPAYMPLRKSSIFKLEPIHLRILQEKLAEKGIRADRRCLYRWVDRREKTQPRLSTALALAEALSDFLELTQMEILRKLARLGDDDADATASP